MPRQRQEQNSRRVSPEENVPAPHSEQALAPGPEYIPGQQTPPQADADGEAEEKLPAPHGAQADAPAPSEYDPAGQAEQSPAPAPPALDRNFPAAHGPHSAADDAPARVE